MPIFSPAKINLYLHITGKRDDGYHLLDSMIAFADIGDEISIEPAGHFQFEINGPYAASFSESERKSTPDSTNLVVQTAQKLAQTTGEALNTRITLTKNLPLAAGIGGGSANAASTIWGLLRYWNIQMEPSALLDFMLDIGADVPACYACESLRITDIGIPDQKDYILPEMPILLVNPGIATHTADVFKSFNAPFVDEISPQQHFQDTPALLDFLAQTQNMLSDAAISATPQIDNVLHSLKSHEGCQLARMSGSGATCFGIFETEHAAENAAHHIREHNPDWWVQAGWLARSGRY